ncbi:MAG: response regulator transcription factor [Eggerthellaceae bacterium]|nr:response regulator transcription factor [Eggerthellaceae bacterium]
MTSTASTNGTNDISSMNSANGAPARILIIEDDVDINDIMAARLGKDGHACTQAWSGSEAALRLDTQEFDLIITDLMLPGLAGEGIVELVRSRSAHTPIIVVSARVTPTDKVSLLKLGADDYLTKPFDLDELAMRVEVQLRHRELRREKATRDVGAVDAIGAASSADSANATAAGDPNIAGSADSADGTGGNATRGAIDATSPSPSDPNHAGAAFARPAHDTRNVTRFGRWEIDSDARTLSVDGRDISLTRLEFNIVELLVKHPRKVFTKRELFELAWGEPYSVEDNTVNVHVSRIRSKLKDTGTDSYISTVWGLGFKLVEE